MTPILARSATAGQATFEPDDEEDGEPEDDEPEDEEPEDELPTVSPDFLPLPPDLSPDDPDDPDDPEEDEESPLPLSDFLPSDPDPFDEAVAGSAFFWLARLSVR
jgi:hypothetical protein